MLKYNDITKKNDNDPSNVKTFKVDYRADIKKKKEDNERLKEELMKRMEEEAKQEVYFVINFLNFSQANANPAPVKKSPAGKGKKEPKKEEIKLDDLNKVNLFNEKEEESKKPLVLSSIKGIARLEGLEFPDDFPIGRYTLVVNNAEDIFGTSIGKISFDLVINPQGGDDKKKKKK